MSISYNSTATLPEPPSINLLDFLSDDLIETHLLPYLDVSSTCQLMESNRLFHSLMTSSRFAHRRLVKDFGYPFEVIEKPDLRHEDSCDHDSLASSFWHSVYNKVARLQYNICHDIKTEFKLELDSVRSHDFVHGDDSDTSHDVVPVHHPCDNALLSAAVNADGTVIATCSKAGLIEVHHISAVATPFRRTQVINQAECQKPSKCVDARDTPEPQTQLLWSRRLALLSIPHCEDGADDILDAVRFDELNVEEGDDGIEPAHSINVSDDNPRSFISVEGSNSIPIKMLVYDECIVVLSDVHGLLVYDLMNGCLKACLVRGVCIPDDSPDTHISSVLASSKIFGDMRNSQIIMASPWCLYVWSVPTFQLSYRISAFQDCIQFGPRLSERIEDRKLSGLTVHSVSLDQTGPVEDCAAQQMPCLSWSTPFAINPTEGSLKSYQMDFLFCGLVPRRESSNDLQSSQTDPRPSSLVFKDIVVYSRVSSEIQIFDASNGSFRGYVLHASNPIRTVNKLEHSNDPSHYYLVSATSNGRISIWSSISDFQCLGSIDLESRLVFDVAFGGEFLCVLRDRRFNLPDPNLDSVPLVDPCADAHCPYSSPRISDTLVDVFHLPANLFKPLEQKTDSEEQAPIVQKTLTLTERRQMDCSSFSCKRLPSLRLLYSRRFPLPRSKSFQINSDSYSISTLFNDVLVIASEYHPIWEPPVRRWFQSYFANGGIHNPDNRHQTPQRNPSSQQIPRLRRGPDWTVDPHTKSHHEYFDLRGIFQTNNEHNHTALPSRLPSSPSFSSSEDLEELKSPQSFTTSNIRCLCSRRLSSVDCHTHLSCPVPGLAFYVGLEKRKLTIESHWVPHERGNNWFSWFSQNK